MIGADAMAHSVEVLPLIRRMIGSGSRHLVAVAVIDARPLIQMMQGVELVPIAVMCFPCLAAIV